MEFLNTKEAAKRLKVSPKTVRWNYCKEGHYMGLVPRKMPNRRLFWPAAEVEKLLAGGKPAAVK